MDLRLNFNEDEANYDKWRPTYVPELFDEIIRFSGINKAKQALEIGSGTGQATLPILQTNCKLTTIEIGERLAEYSRQKFASFSNFEVVNTDFESYSDHRSLPANVKNGLENEITYAINSFGGKLHGYDTMDLYLAKKP